MDDLALFRRLAAKSVDPIEKAYWAEQAEHAYIHSEAFEQDIEAAWDDGPDCG